MNVNERDLNAEGINQHRNKKMVTKFDSADLEKGADAERVAEGSGAPGGHANFYEHSIDQQSISIQDESHEVMIVEQQERVSKYNSSEIGDLATIVKPDTIDANNAVDIF